MKTLHVALLIVLTTVCVTAAVLTVHRVEHPHRSYTPACGSGVFDRTC